MHIYVLTCALYINTLTYLIEIGNLLCWSLWIFSQLVMHLILLCQRDNVQIIPSVYHAPITILSRSCFLSCRVSLQFLADSRLHRCVLPASLLGQAWLRGDGLNGIRD